MSGVTWQTPPDAVWGGLADAQAKALPQIVIDIAVGYLPAIDQYLNNLVPWHISNEPDISEDEPEDLMSWVEFEPPSTIIIYMSHGAMTEPEDTMDKELAYIPQGVDHFGPPIMRDIQVALRGG